jgi:hypothetical protein
MYDLDATFQISDTDLKKGDVIKKGISGSLVMEYPQDEEGRIADGKVRMLHFSMYEELTIKSVATVTSRTHHFAPACNGVESPTWRRHTDPGFPSECPYTGNQRPVAVGFLDRASREIEWAKCKPASTYWSSDRKAYTVDEKSKGKGCLEDLHAVGNVHCQGRLACKWGGLSSGDNPLFDVWTQPLVHGPPGSTHSVSISPDLSRMTSPLGRRGGHLSYNLPNDAPSRTWFSFVATRNPSSAFTTCP